MAEAPLPERRVADAVRRRGPLLSASASLVHYILCLLPSSTAVTDGDCCSGHDVGAMRASSSSRRAPVGA
jgi:hypothetical protein